MRRSRSPGQRDHSWGARDWWGSDWMWSAFHLEDGTHTHLVTTPAFPGSGIGYVQSGSELIELREATSAHEIGEDGLVIRDLIAIPAADVDLDVNPIAYGPVRLAADDGRVSHFVRAMSRVQTPDGRTGLGWIEWNLNQTAPS